MAEARSAVSLNFSDEDSKSFKKKCPKLLSLLFYLGRKYIFLPISIADRLVYAFTFPCSKDSLAVIYGVTILAYIYDKKLSRRFIFSDTFIAGDFLYILLMPLILWIIVAKCLQLLIKNIIFYSIKFFVLTSTDKSFKKRFLYGLMIVLTTIVKFLFWKKKHLYCLQNCLPSLPVPSLNGTVKNWLRSIRPFKTDLEYLNNVLEAEEFVNTYGKKLQFFLYLKYLLTTNYVTDWWEKYVYLRSRLPLILNSNYYICDTPHVFTSSQTWRAAISIWSLINFKREIDSEAIDPIIYSGVTPLCSRQFSRVFNTTRIPLKDKDQLKHWRSGEYMIIWDKGRYYKLCVSERDEIFTPYYIERLIEKIMADPTEPTDAELNLASLTALPRNEWAEIRKEHFSTGINKESLSIIDRAMFMMSFDQDSISFENDDALTYASEKFIHGNGNNIWFDKSFNVIVFKNGRIGINVEHSWADAPIMSQCMEYCVKILANFDQNSNVDNKHFQTLNTKHIMKLTWNLSKLEKQIENSYKICLRTINDCDLRVLNFTDFGKGFVKSIKTSPDAFYQIALQIAYYNDVGRFDYTYESSMTRLFNGGRTETVRSCTMEICHFVSLLEDSSFSKDAKKIYFRKAVDQHVRLLQKSMAGEGCDRHLFTLLVVSNGLGLDIPFLNKIMEEPWKLSTSQTPISLDKSGNKIYLYEYGALGGGFGPVADDGYGVAYFIQESNVIFHICSKNRSKVTNSKRFANNLASALHTLQKLFTDK